MSSELLVHSFVVGASLLAMWIYVRLGDARRPKSMAGVIAHAIVAGIGLALMPKAMRWLIGDTESPRLAAAGLFGMFLPAMTYVFVSALFVFEKLQRALNTR